MRIVSPREGGDLVPLARGPLPETSVFVGSREA